MLRSRSELDEPTPELITHGTPFTIQNGEHHHQYVTTMPEN